MLQNRLYIVLVLSGVLWIPVVAHAQLEFIANGYKDIYLNHHEGPGAEKPPPKGSRGEIRYIYEKPTQKALSHVYWALGMYDIEDNEAVTEFMRVNECDIYRRFFGDDVEWTGVLNATRDFITENRPDFPTRLAFTLPLKLSDYDVKRKIFGIQDTFKVNALRRFEFRAEGRFKPCTEDHVVERGYPRSLLLEFSRPFDLTAIPMEEKVAKDYLESRNRFLKARYPPKERTRRLKYFIRDAYLVMNIKIFAHVKFLGLNDYGIPAVQLLGTLEGYEIYADRSKTQILYRQSYVADRRKNKLDTKLQEQYKILREKAAGEGVFH